MVRPDGLCSAGGRERERERGAGGGRGKRESFSPEGGETETFGGMLGEQTWPISARQFSTCPDGKRVQVRMARWTR